MENQFQLAARLLKTDTLRYTPAGIPVLDVVLQHESIQQENGSPLKVRFELSAKIIGKQAELWQHRAGVMVSVSGFITQRSHKIPRPVLRIQNITEYKG